MESESESTCTPSESSSSTTESSSSSSEGEEEELNHLTEEYDEYMHLMKSITMSEITNTRKLCAYSQCFRDIAQSWPLLPRSYTIENKEFFQDELAWEIDKIRKLPCEQCEPVESVPSEILAEMDDDLTFIRDFENIDVPDFSENVDIALKCKDLLENTIDRLCTYKFTLAMLSSEKGEQGTVVTVPPFDWLTILNTVKVISSVPDLENNYGDVDMAVVLSRAKDRLMHLYPDFPSDRML